MGQARKLIREIQKRMDDIQTEATRLVVFADSTGDAALAARLKRIGRVFSGSVGVDRRLAKLRELPLNGRRERKFNHG